MAARVGLLASEVYFPRQYVAQSALETFDNVSAGIRESIMKKCQFYSILMFF